MSLAAKSPILDIARQLREGKITIGMDLASKKDASAVAIMKDGKVAFLTAPAPKNDDPRMIDFLDDLKTRTADEFRQMYETQWKDMPTLKPSRDYTDINFIEAFENARREWDREVDMSLAIDHDLGYYDPRMLNAWIWGPQGEFTAFAKIRAFEEFDRRATYSRGRETIRDVTLERNRELSHIRFNITLLDDYRNRRFVYDVYDDPSGRRNSCTYTFVQFATYADYVAWEHLAKNDPLGRERRDYASD